MTRVVIVSAKRTPFGKFLGDLSRYSAVDLAVTAGEAALEPIDRSHVQQVILGNILGAGQGMNIARQVAIRLQLPIETSATTINMMCGSGLQSAQLAVNAIRAGEANAILVGGTESMSQAPLLVKRPGKGGTPNLESLADSMLCDGLQDPTDHEHMGQQAENLAKAFQITREQQDQFALRSQQLYQAAFEQGKFKDEVVPLGGVTSDQHPRPGITLADLSSLKTVFRNPGTVTAGNASGVNDGAAMLLLAERDYAIKQDWPILAEWQQGVSVGCEPAKMGLGPVYAIQKLLSSTELSWEAIDRLEINEAFAAQVLSCLKELNLELDDNSLSTSVTTSSGHKIQFNSCGGAIAIGHPLAVSGARLLTHLCCRLHRGDSNAAIAALCIGGGQGIASLLVRHE